MVCGGTDRTGDYRGEQQRQRVGCDMITSFTPVRCTCFCGRITSRLPGSSAICTLCWTRPTAFSDGEINAGINLERNNYRMVKTINKKQGGIVSELNSDYWDCDCDANYIHRRRTDRDGICELCSACENESPDSHVRS